MKRFFETVVCTGIVLAFVTAGGADAGTITTKRMLVQAAAASMMILCGTYFAKRSERV